MLKAGVVLTCTVLISTMLVGAVQDVPSDFFINPKTGELTVTIVVGSEAAFADVVSATMLAATLGTVSTESGISSKTYRAVHENINFSTVWTDPFLEGVGFPTVDVPDAQVYQDYEHTPISYTLKSLWYYDSNTFWSNHDGRFQPWETHEEIQIRFDSSDMDHFINSGCVTCLYGGDINHVSIDEFDVSTHIPGVIYRVDNIFVPPSIKVDMPYNYPYGSSGTGSSSFGPHRIVAVPEPWFILQGMLPSFKLFHTIYTVVDGGAVLDMNARTAELGPLFGTPYLVTGEPYFEPEVHLYKGNPVVFGSYMVELIDVQVAQNKATFEISQDGEILERFWMVLDPLRGFSPNVQQMKFPFDDYDTCNDMNNNKVLDPGEITNIINDYDETEWDAAFNKWVVGTADRDVWGDYHWEYYLDNRNDAWLLFRITDFIMDGVAAFTDDQGSGVEIRVYWLENEKTWYNRLCSDPWAAEPGYSLFLDAYQTGWDDTDANNYFVYQPPGTGMWPQLGLRRWQNENPWTCPYGCRGNLWTYPGGYEYKPSQGLVGNSMFIGNGFLDTNDGHTGYEHSLAEYFFEQNDSDKDNGITNDCRNAAGVVQANCINQYDIEDPVIWHGPGLIVVELNVFLCDSLCAPHSEYTWAVPDPFLEGLYFSIEVADVYFCDDGIDYSTIMGDTNDTPVDIDETGLVILDTEIDFEEWKSSCGYNLILVGGPVANMLVKQLVDDGISTVDWTTSSGQWEYISALYNCDILIVAGKDRYATNAAVQKLIEFL